MKNTWCFLLAAALIAAVSCNKNNNSDEPVPTPDPLTEVVSDPCTHENIEFVDAVKATDTTPGNIAHYRCAYCNRCFLDNQAAQEVKSVNVPAGNLSIDSSILNKIQGIYPFVPSEEQTKAGERTIPKSVGNLINSVKNQKYQMSAMEIIDEVHNSLVTIENSIKEIDSKCADIQKQNSEILKLLKNAPYLSKTQTLLQQAKFIYDKSTKYFAFVKLEHDAYMSGQSTAEQFQTNIEKIAETWSMEKFNATDIYTLTTSMIKEFNGMLVEGEVLTYPELFHKYVAIFRIWDHEGYTDRKQLDIEFESVLSTGYFMACLYRDNVKNYPYAPIRVTDSLELNSQLSQIETKTTQDLDNMDKAYSAYRRFYNGSKELILHPSAIIVNPDVIYDHKGKYEFNFLYYDLIGLYSNSLKEMQNCWDDIYNTGYRAGATLNVSDYTAILSAYSGGNIYDILAQKAKIKDMPKSFLESRELSWGKRMLYLQYKIPSQPLRVYFETENYLGSLLWAKTYYNEFYSLSRGPASEHYDEFYLYSNTLDGNCIRGEEMQSLLYCYCADTDMYGSLYGRKEPYWWQHASASPVFLKKYTGTIYDK